MTLHLSITAVYKYKTLYAVITCLRSVWYVLNFQIYWTQIFIPIFICVKILICALCSVAEAKVWCVNGFMTKGWQRPNSRLRHICGQLLQLCNIPPIQNLRAKIMQFFFLENWCKKCFLSRNELKLVGAAISTFSHFKVNGD